MIVFKKILFWITFIPFAIIGLILATVDNLAIIYTRSVAVMLHAFERYELWANSVPTGYFYNDPREIPYTNVWYGRRVITRR